MATSSSAKGTKRKRSGGIQQRLAQHDLEDKTPCSSKLASFLVEQWVWGKASVQLVQEVAKIACEEMVSNGCDQVPPDLQFLAGLGTSGAHSNNMHRDLWHHFEKTCPMPPMYTTQVPLKNGYTPQNTTLKLSRNIGCLVVNLRFLSSGASFNTIQPWLDTRFF